MKTEPSDERSYQKRGIEMAECRIDICNLRQPLGEPVHVVPKNGEFTVIRNEKNELVPTIIVT